jgi:hypothetical protein
MILSRTKSNKQAVAGQFTGVIEGWLLSRDFPDPDTTAAKAVVWWLPPVKDAMTVREPPFPPCSTALAGLKIDWTDRWLSREN